MAKLTFTGLDGYIAQLEKLRQSADGITKKALYEGAGVTADEIRSAVEALPTDNDRSAGHYLKGITDEQKAALAKGLGVAPLSEQAGTGGDCAHDSGTRCRDGFSAGCGTFGRKAIPH